MTQQTPVGLTYPEAGDHTRLWEHFQQLAQDASAALDPEGNGSIPWSHQYQTTFTFAGGTEEVNYGGGDTPDGWEWAEPPSPILQARANSLPGTGISLAVGNLTTSGFSAHARRSDTNAVVDGVLAVLLTVVGRIVRSP